MDTLRKGVTAGFQTAWKLSKFIFPITFIVTLLQFTPVLPWLIDVISPMMGILGLRGEAAIPLVLGTTLNLYSGIAGILSLELTVKEVFTLAVMLSFAHSMFIETAVALRVGVRLWVVLVVRFGLAFLSAIVINLVWDGGGEIAKYGMMPETATNPEGWGAIVLLGLERASLGIFQLIIIVLPLMIIVQFLRDYGYLMKLSKMLAPWTKVIGVKPNASVTLVTGLVIGLAYGAGVMIQAVEEDGVSKKDATLSFIFLVACHAVVEDTLIFAPLGIPILPLLAIRVVTAFILTIIVARLWKRAEVREAKGALQQ
ncbi:MAG: nucleoside recognition domain-containing protein [Lysinibacillus sp.]